MSLFTVYQYVFGCGVDGGGVVAFDHTAVPEIECSAGNLVWAGFLVFCFLYKINPNPRKNICCGEKSSPNATFTLIFSRVRLALGGGVRRFHDNLYMLSNTTEFGTSQTP